MGTWVYHTNGTALSESDEINNNANIIINYYRNIGWEDNAIAGLLGNIENESGFNPLRKEVGGSGYGLVQWTPKSVLVNHASNLGLSNYNNGYTQLKVIQSELKPTNGNNEWYSSSAFVSKYYRSGATSDMVGYSGEEWYTNTMGFSADKMAVMFMACYERPSYNPKTNHYDRRMEDALKWLAYMGGEIPPDSGGGDDDNPTDAKTRNRYIKRSIIPLLKGSKRI